MFSCKKLMPDYLHLKTDQISHFIGINLLIGQIKWTHLANMKNKIPQLAPTVSSCFVESFHGLAKWTTISMWVSLIFSAKIYFLGSKHFPYIAKIKLHTLEPLYLKNTWLLSMKFHFTGKPPVITGEILL